MFSSSQLSAQLKISASSGIRDSLERASSLLLESFLMIVLHKSIHTSPTKLDFWSLHNGLYTCSPPAFAGFSFAVNVALLTFQAEILSSWKPSSNACSLMWPSLFCPGACAHSLFTNLPPVSVVSVLVSAALDCYSRGQWSPPPPSMFTPYLLIKKQKCWYLLGTNHCAHRGE